ncbi:hypothetical protein ACJRO7_027422 [Eucalyptus globulus]|uniref:Protein kinase domain-containing protein n=1 Tax=Eucalyptus globulus TaxID=34317 RepID=A0ABD3JVV1_EUCGL
MSQSFHYIRPSRGKIHSFNAMYMYRVFLLTLHVLLLGISCDAKNSHLCPVSSCGEIRNISYPFRLKGDPKYCGHPEFELTCEYDHTVLYLFDGRYYVKSIHYNYYRGEEDLRGFITVVDDGLQKGNCSSLPHYSLGFSNFSNSIIPYYPQFSLSEIVMVAFVKCLQPIAFTRYFDTKPCIEGTHSADMPPNTSQMKVYSYALPGSGYHTMMSFAAGDIKDSCTITMMSFAPDYSGREGDRYNRSSASYKDLHNQMAEGFNLTYGLLFSAYRSFRFCFLGSRYQRNGCSHYYVRNSKWSTMYIVARNAAPNLAFVMVEEKAPINDENIEEFLQAHNNFMPIRYSYSDIKKITRNFKHKLGEGGYGSVYKGILRSGNEVAVKILNKPKSNGQDFISEVGTIGRIHHVNVVQLVGFCFNKSKQALVYDYMSNRSLDKHIFSKDGYYSLDYKRIYEISLGVARGIAYLHRGCDMQILHFDIKPHNILLDQNFTPKVFDFGLAKLYPTNHNVVSLTVARGTLGYMAPELFYKDIGGVSYKVDVYSFGMLLMEMAGRRRNVNAKADRSSQIYFPLWVYDQLHEENEIEMEVVQEEREIVRKMVIVALWCIQLIPNDRPSMTKVLDMLEGDINKLQLPPKPLLYPSEEPVDDVYTGIELESCSISSSTPTIF